MHFNRPTSNAIPPLLSGGVMLSYKCTSACRHCLYRCSPNRPDEWMTLETAQRVFETLAREPMLGDMHLAGGEATLRFDLLLETIRMAGRHDIRLCYLETNAGWCADRNETRQKLLELRQAGLPGLLVSASMFHNEFIPFDYTRNCVEAAREVFGRGAVLVWLPTLYEALAQMPDPDKTRSLKKFCEQVGLEEWSPRVPELYNLIPGGRAPKALRKCYPAHPAKHFRRDACAEQLYRVTHFHIDLYGNLFTGFCAGIAPGDIDNLHPEITPESTPVFDMLCRKGPYGLAEMAKKEYGFTTRDDGYVSKCDLCYDARKCLHASGEFAELRPADYYSD